MTSHTRTISADTAPDWTGENLIRAAKLKTAPPAPSAKIPRLHFGKRRVVVAGMFNGGKTPLDIAVKLGCSKETIMADLRATGTIAPARPKEGDPAVAIAALKAFCKREKVTESLIYDAADKGEKTSHTRSDCLMEMRDASNCQYSQIANIVGRAAHNVQHSIKMARKRREAK